MKNNILIAFIFCLYVNISFDQNNLSLEKIMQGYDFIGYPPKDISWSWDSKKIYFQWNPDEELIYSTYYYDLEKKSVFKNPIEESYQLLLNDNNQEKFNHIYFIENGNLFIFDKKTKNIKCLVQTSIPITNFFVGNEENIVVYKQGHNLFKLNIQEGSTKQLTNFIENKIESKNKNISGYNFLEQQQFELFDYIKNEKNKKYLFDELNKNSLKLPLEININNFQLEQIQSNFNSSYVSFVLSDYPQENETEILEFVNETGYSKIKKARAKVSINNLSKHKLGIFNVLKDSVYFIDFDNLPHLGELPSYLSLYSQKNHQGIKNYAIHPLIFAKNSETALVDIRSLDNKHRWIVLLYLAEGRYDVLDYQHDSAWIGGPGISEWNFVPAVLGFDKNENNIYFQSEESGFSHLYMLNISNRVKNQITKGNFEVKDVVYDSKNNCFYLHLNKSNLGNIDFYKYDIVKKQLTCVLEKEGAFQAYLSPNNKELAYLYSSKNKPWELFYKSFTNNIQEKQITDSRSDDFKKIEFSNPKIIELKNDNGTIFFARLFEASKIKDKKAAVMFVHGAGYLQNAHNYWSFYYRENLFHHLLASEGITVIDIDYSASEGYGRDFRTSIYRNMGGKDLDDYIFARKYLIKNYNIDSNKIAIYGGSYGGFLTLMALLKYPGKFVCGAALRAVTDWAHYNLEYTSNILNFPETDPEAYRNSSPIYYAENLKDELLILHGLVDDNVQYQDVIRFSERLIEKGKKNWSMNVYPIESHGFVENYSWLDEYSRIYHLFKKYLY